MGIDTNNNVNTGDMISTCISSDSGCSDNNVHDVSDDSNNCNHGNCGDDCNNKHRISESISEHGNVSIVDVPEDVLYYMVKSEYLNIRDLMALTSTCKRLHRWWDKLCQYVVKKDFYYKCNNGNVLPDALIKVLTYVSNSHMCQHVGYVPFLIRLLKYNCDNDYIVTITGKHNCNVYFNMTVTIRIIPEHESLFPSEEYKIQLDKNRLHGNCIYRKWLISYQRTKYEYTYHNGQLLNHKCYNPNN